MNLTLSNCIHKYRTVYQGSIQKYSTEIIAILSFLCFFLLPTKYGFINSCTAILTLTGLAIALSHKKEQDSYHNYWHNIKHSHFISLFILLWLPVVLSIFNAHQYLISIKTSFALLRYLFVFFAIILMCQNNKIYQHLKTATALLLILWCFDGMFQWLVGYNLLGYPYDRGGIEGTSRLSGIFAPKFQLGYVVATLSPLVFEWCYQVLWKQYRQRIVALFITIMLILTVFLSGSRAAWLSLFVAIILFLSYHTINKNIHKKTVMILVLIFFVTSIASLSLPSIRERVLLTIKPVKTELSTSHYENINGLEQTLNIASSYRIVLWEASYKFFMQNPILGIGASNFKYEYAKLPVEEKRELEEGFHPHFHALEIAAETGIIGLICYLVMYLTLIRITFKAQAGYEWLLCTLLAIFPLNMHVSIYSSFWQGLIFIPLGLGLSVNTYQTQKITNAK